ncbi:MAG: hypothetical protein WC058_13675 [Phycisphaeraceae bacterium]
MLLRTVLLRHDRTGDSHIDWLIEHPHHPPHTGPLLAFRLPAACGLASASPLPRKCLAYQLPDHRRLYLTYQGPVSPNKKNFRGRGRGRVRRIDTGHVTPHRFSLDRIDLRLTLRRATWHVHMRRVAIDTWSAAFIPV